MSLFITKPTGHFIFIQFNVPFKIISAHMRRTNQWVPGLKREDPEKKKKKKKTHDTPASRSYATCGDSNPHQTQRRDRRMVKCGNEISAQLR